MAAYEQKTGGSVLAIAHNGNLSNGAMFPLIESFTGKPVDEEDNFFGKTTPQEPSPERMTKVFFNNKCDLDQHHWRTGADRSLEGSRLRCEPAGLLLWSRARDPDPALDRV